MPRAIGQGCLRCGPDDSYCGPCYKKWVANGRSSVVFGPERDLDGAK